MDPCERDVITAHKLHLLSQEEMRERKKKLDSCLFYRGRRTISHHSWTYQKWQPNNFETFQNECFEIRYLEVTSKQKLKGVINNGDVV